MKDENFKISITRIIIAGLLGAILLTASFYLILNTFYSNYPERGPSIAQRPEGYDIGPGAVVYGALTILAFILSALMTGFISNFLARDRMINAKPPEKKIISSIRRIGLRIFYSFTAGLTTFVFIWFELIILRVNELGIRDLSVLFMFLIGEIFNVGILYFFMIAIVFAFFSVFGGICYGLVFNTPGEKGLKI
jgi:hypothetical protein